MKFGKLGKQLALRVLVGGVGGTAAAVFTWFLLTGISLAPKPQTSADFAAWTQAIFSVLAIGAAIWISDRQHRVDVERMEQAKRSRASDQLQIAIDLCERAITMMKSLPSVGVQPEKAITLLESFSVETFQRVCNTLERFGPQDVPSGTALLALLELRQVMPDVMQWLNITAENSFFASCVEESWDEAASELERLKGIASNALATLKKEQQRYIG